MSESNFRGALTRPDSEARRAYREQALLDIKAQCPNETSANHLLMLDQLVREWDAEGTALPAIHRALLRFRQMDVGQSPQDVILMLGASLEAEGIDSAELVVHLPCSALDRAPLPSLIPGEFKTTVDQTIPLWSVPDDVFDNPATTPA